MKETLDAAQLVRARVRQRAESPTRTSYTLPSELLAEASRRLGWLGLVYSGAIVVGHFGHRALLAWTGHWDPALHIDVFALAAVAMGVAVYAVSRSGGVSPKRLLDLGLVFEVAGAFGIAGTRIWTGVPQLAGSALALVPGECVWIVAYPLVVPNTPRNVLVASLLAASVGPMAVVASSAISGSAIDRSLLLRSHFVPTYLSALVAYAVARIVHRVNVRLKQAREIGSYELIDRLGEGGMGEVWRAKHRLLARPAAVKLIRDDILGSAQRTRDAVIRRFEREAQDTAMLGSPHTIDVYDFGVTEEGAFYYVMELLNGISLERCVQLYGPMESGRAVYLLRQACHSLGEAHARGLVHRDIKPANIFTCRLGPDDDFVKVLDFGLVKHAALAATVRQLTVAGSTAGTPAYMAPEMALARPDVDGRADIYSLGCVAYFLLTGQTPFAAETAVAMALAHINDAPIAPSVLSEFEIPPALDALILECLAKSPEQRPASAVELAKRLAATVPQGAWTPEAAHVWWELHHVSHTHNPASSALSNVTASMRQRAWPHVDHKAAHQEPA